jgi:hypothetical protein
VAATLLVEKLDKSVVKHRTIRYVLFPFSTGCSLHVSHPVLAHRSAKRASPNAAIEVEELTPSVTNELLVEAFSAFGGGQAQHNHARHSAFNIVF